MSRQTSYPFDSKVYTPEAVEKQKMKNVLGSYYEAEYACNMHYMQMSRKFFKPSEEEMKTGHTACVMAKMEFIDKLVDVIESSRKIDL